MDTQAQQHTIWLRTLVHLHAIVFAVLFALGLATPVYAKAKASQDFEFIFRLDRDSELTTRVPSAQAKFEFRTHASNYEEAFKKAAQACFTHFKAGRQLSEDEGLSIIDSCANPRGS